MYNNTTVTDTLKTLKEEGYELDFNLKPDCIECKSSDIKMHPDDFVIDKFFRFEGLYPVMLYNKIGHFTISRNKWHWSNLIRFSGRHPGDIVFEDTFCCDYSEGQEFINYPF